MHIPLGSSYAQITASYLAIFRMTLRGNVSVNEIKLSHPNSDRPT